MSLRNLLLKLHLWIGLGAAILIFLLALSGAMLVFEGEIDRMLNPKLLTVTPGPTNLPLSELAQKAKAAFPGKVPTSIVINPNSSVAWGIILGGKGGPSWVYINPHTGQITGSRDMRRAFVQQVHQFHTNLLMGRNAEKIVGYGTLCLFLLMITGLILWWKRKLLTVETRGSWRRINFDLHHVSGIYSYIFLFVIVASGLIMAFPAQGYGLVELVLGDSAREVPEDKPESAPKPGVQAMPLEQALALAQKELPGAQPTFIQFSPAPKAVYSFAFKFPEDGTPGGRSRVILDKYSGEVLWRESSREQVAGVKFVNMIRPLHTGDIYGWPSRIAYALASFSVVVQAITGVIIWVARLRRKSQAKRVAAVPAEVV